MFVLSQVLEDHHDELWDFPEIDDHVISSDHQLRYSSLFLTRDTLTTFLSDGLSVQSQLSQLRPRPLRIRPISIVPGRSSGDERLCVQSAVPETAVLQ